MTEGRAFGLYVHWPFCQAKCPYCDFNSHVVSAVDQSDWVQAFQAEIRRVAPIFPNRVLNTIYFGGGTPSLMAPSTVESIVHAARETWNFANDIEITLEANPSSAEIENFRGYALAGVNRVSVGVQALNDNDLRALGRLHTAGEAKSAVRMAQEIFPRVSFDLIYGRQNQSLAEWETELGQALAMSNGHLSLYQLTIEPETAFGERFRRGGLRGLPDDDLSADMFDLTQHMTEDAGLPAYEISNHAAPGFESQHNLIYWRGHDWIGIGPGAHGRFTSGHSRVATEAHALPQAWLSAVSNGSGDFLNETLSQQDVLEEKLLMGLRLRDGIRLGEPIYDSNIRELVDDGLLQFKDRLLRTTDKGRPLLNAILRKLLA